MPLQFLILLVSGWIARRQGEAIEYLRAENRVLRARIGCRRLRFTDAERRLLAEKGKPIGRKLLAEMASLATPETILRWYRQRVAAKYDGSRVRGAHPREPASLGGALPSQAALQPSPVAAASRPLGTDGPDVEQPEASAQRTPAIPTSHRIRRKLTRTGPNARGATEPSTRDHCDAHSR
jgi:hypothetical protein